MLYREIMAVCSQIHTKHINTLYWQNVELLNVKLVVHIVPTGFFRVKSVFDSNNNLHSARIPQSSAPQPLPTTSSRTSAVHHMQ